MGAETFGSSCASLGVHAMGKRPRSKSPCGIQPTAMKALRAQGVSLEVIAGATQMWSDVQRRQSLPADFGLKWLSESKTLRGMGT